MSQELAFLKVQKNITCDGKIYSKQVQCESSRIPQSETNVIRVNQLAEVENLIVPHITNPKNGITRNGNFVLHSTTDQQEWVIHDRLEEHISHHALVGNRVGQMCFVFVSLTCNIEGKEVDLRQQPLFVHVPESFQPHTEVSCSLQRTSGLSLSTTSHAAITFDTQSNHVFLSTPTGTWQPGETIFGSFSYFCC